MKNPLSQHGLDLSANGNRHFVVPSTDRVTLDYNQVRHSLCRLPENRILFVFQNAVVDCLLIFLMILSHGDRMIRESNNESNKNGHIIS